MNFDWNDLRFFIAIAESGNLARAAARLRVNHSTVFRRLQALEVRLGVRLFERLPEGYLLTGAGEQALKDARAAEAAVSDLQRKIAGKDVSPAGLVRLTTAPKLATDFVAPALGVMAQRHPDIRVELLVSDSDYDLGRREADLALRATDHPPEHLSGRKVTTVSWWVMAGEAYLERHAPPRSMAELADHALIGGDEGFDRLPVFRRLRREFASDRFTATSNDLSTMAAMARAGLGLAVLPMDQDGPGLVALFPLQPAYSSGLWLLTHPDLRRVARVRAAARFLFEHLRRDPRLAPRMPAARATRAPSTAS